jgi:hypothetical protein
MDEIISYKMCGVKVRNAKLRNYLNIPNNYLIINEENTKEIVTVKELV